MKKIESLTPPATGPRFVVAWSYEGEAETIHRVFYNAKSASISMSRLFTKLSNNKPADKKHLSVSVEWRRED